MQRIDATVPASVIDEWPVRGHATPAKIRGWAVWPTPGSYGETQATEWVTIAS